MPRRMFWQNLEILSNSSKCFFLQSIEQIATLVSRQKLLAVLRQIKHHPNFPIYIYYIQNKKIYLKLYFFHCQFLLNMFFNTKFFMYPIIVEHIYMELILFLFLQTLFFLLHFYLTFLQLFILNLQPLLYINIHHPPN